MIRLAKLMAQKGLCSRREAEVYMVRGWVSVNGETVTQLGTRVPSDCTITLDSEAQTAQHQKITVILNKPVGYVSGQPESLHVPAIRLIKLSAPGLAVAGRLDVDSQGLLVFTQDGRIARQLLGGDLEKEYIVRVRGKLSDLSLLRHGLELDGMPLRAAQVEWINDDQLRFILKQGRKRQIRRMCQAVGLEVMGLKRVRIGQIKLGGLPEGQWRYLNKGERF